MAKLCKESMLDIALDEELISVHKQNRSELLDVIRPTYIILKPSLLGGFAESEHWISLCEERSIKWWVTSALESNIGLEAIAEWAYMLKNPLPQGLGTGQLYTNNVKSPLQIERGSLYYRK
jgi:O-succinylbenzoate synthase